MAKTASSESSSTENHISTKLAELLLGWKAAQGRFLKPGGGWCPQWRFRPFVRIADAYMLLDCTERFQIVGKGRNDYSVAVQIRGRIAKGEGPKLASVITTAVARAAGVEI
jgi:hypothetical protein